VARDEAIAEAAARDEERQRKDRESEATISLLRDRSHSALDKSQIESSEQDKQLLTATSNLRDSRRDSRKRKRLPGEDDTDRDLRYAKERTGDEEKEDKAVIRLRPTKLEDTQAPITDQRGNINLFPERKPEATKISRQSELEREKEKQRNTDENYGMHLKDVLGRKDSKGTWYLDKDGVVKDSVGRDVWGNEDPRRQTRQAERITSSDPLAFMKKAQKQLKEVQRDRMEREVDLEQLRSRQLQEQADLDDFSLDEPGRTGSDRRKHYRRRKEKDRNRSRDKNETHSRIKRDNHHHQTYDKDDDSSRRCRSPKANYRSL
jgi:hypothetical protein